jgi:hypothetical protein
MVSMLLRVLSELPALRLKSFSLVDDSELFNEDGSLEAGVSLEYGCGLFEFVKAHG